MAIRSVCLLGATGFVGRAVCARLFAAGLEVRVLTRQRTRANPLLVLPTIDVRVGDPHDEEALTRPFEGVDAVVNLAGILHPARGATFQSVHAELPRKVANACRAAGVRRLVHLSALGAAETAPSEYLRSKARGEAAARQGGGDALEVVVVRPSVIFGAEDHLLNRFSKLLALFPVIPLAAAQARLQPVWVEDVARAITHAVRHSTPLRAYELCGPRSYTLEELVALVARLEGRRCRIAALPEWAGELAASVLQYFPGSLKLTPDNLRSLGVANTCAGPFPIELGFQPTPIESVAPSYLAGGNPRGRYPAFRYRAGR